MCGDSLTEERVNFVWKVNGAAGTEKTYKIDFGGIVELLFSVCTNGSIWQRISLDCRGAQVQWAVGHKQQTWREGAL